MKAAAIIVAAIVLSAASRAFGIDSPEWTVPNPPFLASMSADQRAAWFAWQRARSCETERDELLGKVRELQRKVDVLTMRKGENV
jgi:hypothetical protein